MAQEAADDASPPVEDKQSRLWFLTPTVYSNILQSWTIQRLFQHISTFSTWFNQSQRSLKMKNDAAWCRMIQHGACSRRLQERQPSANQMSQSGLQGRGSWILTLARGGDVENWVHDDSMYELNPSWLKDSCPCNLFCCFWIGNCSCFRVASKNSAGRLLVLCFEAADAHDKGFRFFKYFYTTWYCMWRHSPPK